HSLLRRQRKMFISDRSSTSAIPSVSYAFPFAREIRLLTRHYRPEPQFLNAANKTPACPRQWVKAGWIRPTPGDCIVAGGGA
ncbi:hypothetical protein JQN46_27060, partial [Enterobacter hormaechei]|nr:hypothetical protein [Enterobacter hormaechei]